MNGGTPFLMGNVFHGIKALLADHSHEKAMDRFVCFRKLNGCNCHQKKLKSG